MAAKKFRGHGGSWYVYTSDPDVVSMVTSQGHIGSQMRAETKVPPPSKKDLDFAVYLEKQSFSSSEEHDKFWCKTYDIKYEPKKEAEKKEDVAAETVATPYENSGEDDQLKRIREETKEKLEKEERLKKGYHAVDNLAAEAATAAVPGGEIVAPLAARALNKQADKKINKREDEIRKKEEKKIRKLQEEEQHKHEKEARSMVGSSGGGLMTDLAAKTKDVMREHVHGDAPHNLRVLFLLAILFQLVDVFFLRFDRNAFRMTAIGMYLALTVLGAFWFRKEGHFVNVKQILIFTMISAFYIVIPSFLYLVPKIQLFGGTTVFCWVNFLLAILPIWPIYIGLKAEIPFVHKYVNFWILFLLFLFIFGVGLNFRASMLTSLGGRPQLLQAGEVVSFLYEKTIDVAQSFWKAMNPAVIIPRFMNSTGLAYYTGMVDENEKAPVGLYLDNVRIIEKYFYEGSPVVVWVDVKGKSFNEEIIVTPACYIEDGGSGEPYPRSFSIFGQEQDTLSCTFEGLTKGSYLAKVQATFNFETWAYVDYTFVDVETRRSFEMQGKDINSELGIESLPRAIYSNGPIMLGMASMVDQPIGVDTKYNTREPILGVTFDNLWSEGEPHPKEYIILVPDDFDLVKCDRGTPTIEHDKIPDYDKEVPGYDIYIFNKELLGDPRQGFQSLTCRLHIKDDKLSTFLSGSQKITKTFVAMAKYDYVLKKSVRFYVKE